MTRQNGKTASSTTRTTSTATTSTTTASKSSSNTLVESLISYMLLRMKRYMFLIKKALTMNLQPNEETFPELNDIIVWFRCIVAILYGAYIGRRREHSAIFILQSLNIIGFIPILYIRLYLNMNETNIKASSYGNKLFFAGLLNSIALVILIWMYYFTLYHSTEENILNNMLFNSTTTNIDDPYNNTMSSTTTMMNNQQETIEEQEF